MIEEMACPVCGCNRATEVWSHVSGIADGVCVNCGHAYLIKQKTCEEILASYRHFKQAYTDDYLKDTGNAIFQLARLRHAYLDKHGAEKLCSVLEVGCAYGHFLSLFEAPVFCAGIEPSLEQSDFAARHFHLSHIVNSPYETLGNGLPDWPVSGFDLICSFHVIEHVKNPGQLLEFAYRTLRPQGYICLAAPNLFDLSPDLIEYYFLYKNWHLNTFYPESISLLLAKHGFELVHWQPEPAVAMLRSSFILIARKTDGQGSARATDADPEKAIQALSAFHSELDHRVESIKRWFDEWFEQGLTVCVFGGGMHTTALLELADVAADKIKCVIDDDPEKWRSTLQGISVVSMEDALRSNPDVIVVSSLASEDIILRKLENTLNGNIRIFGIYRDMVA